MPREADLIRIRHWFETYVLQFFTGDDHTDSALRIKVEHTKNVAIETCCIAASLDMDAEQCYLAEIIALLHDIGRFEQFSRYRTYSDRESEDHARLGVEVIGTTGVLERFTGEMQRFICSIVGCHNRITLPEMGDPLLLHYLRILRDADKIDILRVVTEYYAGYSGNDAISIGLPDTPGVADAVLRSVIEERMVSICDVKSLNDIKLLQISWVFDLNFPYTCAMIKNHRYLDKLAAALPQTGLVTQAVDTAQRFLQRRCSEERRNCECLIP
ncbi:MAG: HD domain-containing protein [Chitinispirillaceae bacterium]|nr:HD domain-containing protein [Chitinispirillaceae bacterium]